MTSKAQNARSKLVALRIPHALHRKLQASAKRSKQTVSESIRSAVERQMSRQRKGAA